MNDVFRDREILSFFNSALEIYTLEAQYSKHSVIFNIPRDRIGTMGDLLSKFQTVEK